MASRANPLHTIGQTQDGRQVVGGLFSLYDTYGYPLELAFADLRDAHCLPGLEEFYRDALAAGWTYKRLRGKVNEALTESYGMAYTTAALARLDAWHRDHGGT